MTDTEYDGSILVVDDEQAVADAYALRLRTRFDTVNTAYGGEAALEELDELDGDVDVMLLDRRMPDLWGDEVLEEVRSRGFDLRVIMVTAVNPDFDLMEMPFDDYLQKPIQGEVLYDAVEQQLRAEDYEASVSEFFSITSKIGILEAEKTNAELDDNDEYQTLLERRDELDSELDDTVDGFSNMTTAFASIDRT